MPEASLRDSSLTEAQDWLRERVDSGERCPCCTQLAKIYYRHINASMAFGLITMYRAHGREWGHAPTTSNVAKLGGELARLRLWGLLEELKQPREDGGRAGWWRITELGEKFIRNEVSLPNTLRLYDGRVIGVGRKEGDLEQCTMPQALGNKFDYNELIRGI